MMITYAYEMHSVCVKFAEINFLWLCSFYSSFILQFCMYTDSYITSTSWIHNNYTVVIVYTINFDYYD